METVRKVDNS